MRDVSDCAFSLRALEQMWRLIEASAKMNCPQEAQTILPTMAATRAGLGQLERDLVYSLVNQKVGNVLEAIGTKAQYVIDIVVRNLYERTADVGFLATDRELCAFVASGEGDVDAIRYRLQQYRAKYSVYEEILLLDLKGNVLVQIDPDTPLEGSKDPVLTEALERPDYIELFRATDLRPGKARGLVYARRMESPATRTPIGVLCLCFGFEEEMARIFRSHRDEEGRSIMLLLDEHQHVIASSDEYWIAPGTQVPVNPDAEPRRMIHGGREYLVRTFKAAGYQGYPGPTGWQGQVMVPLELAFSGKRQDTLASLSPELAAGLLSHARTFSPPLFEMINATEAIRRVVWNGQVVTAGKSGEQQKLKTILEQISETGMRSRELFSSSIRDLYNSVLDSKLDEAEFTALLLVDLLDRNLYERANDCRWWALTPDIRAALAESEPTPDTLQHITEILRYIHRLYTVYSGLYVYDRDGRILASSVRDHDAPSQITQLHHIGANRLEAVLRLRNDQDYCVTPFEACELDHGRHTYVYHAAIRDLGDATRILGGIAIVFDAETEFADMLRGGIGGREQAAAFYLDRAGRILSSTDPAKPVGSRLELPAELLALPAGQSAARIVEHDGQYAIAGVSASQGYREFKNSDGYRDDVLAVVFSYLGEVRCSQALQSAEVQLDQALPPGSRGGKEFATFFSAGSLLGLAADQVSEALPASALSARSMKNEHGLIGMLAPQKGSALSHFTWVFDLGYMLRQRHSVLDNRSQIIIVRHHAYTMGLLVDELHGVPEFSTQQIMELPFDKTGPDQLIKGLVKAGEQALLQLIDIEQLFKRLRLSLES